jgi:hypothetical protein
MVCVKVSTLINLADNCPGHKSISSLFHAGVPVVGLGVVPVSTTCGCTGTVNFKTGVLSALAELAITVMHAPFALDALDGLLILFNNTCVTPTLTVE